MTDKFKTGDAVKVTTEAAEQIYRDSEGTVDLRGKVGTVTLVLADEDGTLRTSFPYDVAFEMSGPNSVGA